MSDSLRHILDLLSSGKIPDAIPDDCPEAESLRRLVDYLADLNDWGLAVASGDLSRTLTSTGPLAGSFKGLHSALRHLAWQVDQVADGDFSQRIPFMGDFSLAFNGMVERLGESQSEIHEINTRLWAEIDRHLEAEAHLRECQTDLQFIAEHGGDVIWRVDQNLLITSVSTTDETLRGFPASDVIGTSLESLTTADGWVRGRKAFARFFEAEAAGHPMKAIRFEAPLKTQDGSTVWADVSAMPIRDKEGGISGFLGLSRDVTAKKENEEHHRHQALHDPLTGLFNRPAFDEEFSRLMDAGPFPLTVLVVDLDGLNAVNEAEGHAAGDIILRKSASVLRRSMHGSNFLARIGDDEFAALLPEADEKAAKRTAELISAQLTAANAANPIVSFSLGLAIADDGPSMPGAFKEADDRMYADKAARKKAHAEGKR